MMTRNEYRRTVSLALYALHDAYCDPMELKFIAPLVNPILGSSLTQSLVYNPNYRPSDLDSLRECLEDMFCGCDAIDFPPSLGLDAYAAYVYLWGKEDSDVEYILGITKYCDMAREARYAKNGVPLDNAIRAIGSRLALVITGNVNNGNNY